MTVRGAVSLGIGAMVGAGIFTLLGEAGAIAGSAVWLSFVLGGLVAALLGYVVAKLGTTYPSSGGLLTFLEEGFGKGHLAGILSWLLYFSVIIVTAMVALSFGNYAAALFFGPDGSDTARQLFTIGAIVGLALVNIVGAALVDRIASSIVGVLLVVFVVFIVLTVARIDTELLAPSTYPPGGNIISSVALTFFAYLGFAVITYTGGDLANPTRDMPRALYLALAITTGLYVLISVGVFGTLTVDEVVSSGGTALAEAIKPILGDAGYALMSIAALLATASSINANIYGAVGATSMLSAGQQFPPVFGRPGIVGGTRGLGITVLAVLVLATVADISAIASIGSVVALALFVMVAVAGMKLRGSTGSKAWVIALAIIAGIVAVVAHAIETIHENPATFWAMIGVLVLAIALEFTWSALRTRRAERGAG